MSAISRPGAVAWSLVRTPYRHILTLFPDLTGPERQVCEAFARGAWVDLRLPGSREAGREVRAGVIGALLAGAAEAEPGMVPALRLRGARVTGRLDLAGACVHWLLACEQCEFGAAVVLAESETRTVSFTGCRLPGLDGTGMRLTGSLDLSNCQVGAPDTPGAVTLRGTKISGAVHLAGTRIACPGQRALAADCAEVGGGLDCGGLAASGAICLRGARVAGGVNLAGAMLASPGTVACCLSGAVVAGDVTCDGITVAGTLAADGASVGGRFSLDGATLDGHAAVPPAGAGYARGGSGEAVRARALRAGEFTLRAAGTVRGTVDLRHARVGVLHDDPECWPAALSLGGLTYQALEPRLPARERVRWLARDPGGFQPQPYSQLARHYAATGQPAQARVVLLAWQRRQRRRMTLLPRLWGILQDVTVGYGYRPWRVAAWLAGLLGGGTAAFTAWPPRAVLPGPAPHVHAFAYTLDLLLPVAGLGLRHAYRPSGPGVWVSYLLIAAGWVLLTTVAAAAARSLVRR